MCICVPWGWGSGGGAYVHPAPIPGLCHCPPPPPTMDPQLPNVQPAVSDAPSEYDKSFTGPRPSLRLITKVPAKVKRHQFALLFVATN